MEHLSKALVYYDINTDDNTGEIAAQDKISDDEHSRIKFINQKIASVNNLRDTIKFLFDETRSLLPCDRIGIAFFEEEGRRLKLFYVIANYEPLELNEGYTADVSGSSLEKIFSYSTPRIINDLDEYARSHDQSESTMMLLAEGVKSSMTCPLMVEGRPVGLLFRSSKKANVYSGKEVLIHMLISERLSQAVEKAYRIEQLSAAINSYMEMLGFVTHELKSPLDSIITMGKTITAGYLGNISEKHKDYLERIIKKAEYLSNIANDYLNLARFESGSAQFNPKELDFVTDIIDEAIDIIRPQAEAKNMSIEKDFTLDSLRITCEQSQIKIVLVNLLSNAVKYGNETSTINISLKDDRTNITVSVHNQGPGFSLEEKSKLFRKFSRLQSKELIKQKGSGIGLYTSWKIIQLHNGRIWADSQEGQWAQFSFLIPRAP